MRITKLFNIQTPQRTSNNKDANNMTARTLNGMLWMFSGNGSQAAFQFLVMIILARLLTPENFGLIAAAQVIIGFTDIFSQLGIGPAIVQRSDITVNHIRTGFIVSVIFGLTTAVLIILVAPLVANFFHMEELIPILQVMSIIFVLKGISVVSEALLQRGLYFRKIALIQLLSFSLGYGLVAILLALMDFGTWALVGGVIAQNVLKSTLLLLAKPHPIGLGFDLSALRELTFFGGGFTLGRIANYIALQGDNLIIGRWLGSEALGIYGRAYQLMSMPALLFGQVLDKVLFPSMAKVQNEPLRLANAYRRGIALTALIALPLNVIVFILAPEIVEVLFGTGWEDVIIPLQLLSLGMLFRTSYKISESIARAKGAVYRRAWRQGVYALSVLLGAWVGQHWGLAGVAIGVVGALFINFVLMANLIFSLNPIGLKTFISVHFPAILSSLVIYTEIKILVFWLRSIDLSPLITLIVSLCILFISFSALLYFAPRLFLGKDGIWMLGILLKILSKKGKFIFKHN